MEPLTLDHLVLDLNGTLTNRGELIKGVENALGRLRGRMRIHVATADTFGTADIVAAELELELERISDGAAKARLVTAVGAEHTAAIGNGANDMAMLQTARLGIAVLGPEGTSAAALSAADIVCGSILDALALVADPRAVHATLRR
jgi:P-type E1-E2 ATPase